MKKLKFIIFVFTLLIFNNAKSAVKICATNNGKTECAIADYPSCKNGDLLDLLGEILPQGWTCGSALKIDKIKFSFIGQLPDGRAFVYDDGEKVKIVSDNFKEYVIQSLKLIKEKKLNKEEVKKEVAKRLISDAGTVSIDRLNKLSAELDIPIIKTDKIGKPISCPTGYEMKDGNCQRIGIPTNTQVKTSQSTDCPWGYVLENGVCVTKKYGPVISNDHRVFVCYKHNLAIVSYHSNSFGEIVIDDVIDLGSCGSNFLDHLDFSVINGGNWTEATEKQYQEINSLVIKKTKIDSAEIILQIKQATGSTTTKTIWYNPAKIKSEVRSALGIGNCPTGFVWENAKCVPQLDVPTTPQSISEGGGKCKCGGCSWYGKCKDFDAHNCKSSKLQSNHTMVTNKAFIFIGGGATLPGKPTKTVTALPILGNVDINAYMPLVKKKTWSIGLNAGTAFGISNKFADDGNPEPFQVQNQTGSPTISAKGSGSLKNAGFKFEAGPALMVMIKDKFGIMPVLNVSYRYIAQKSVTYTQTSVVSNVSYNWDILSRTQTKNNVVAFDPKLRLLYMFGRVGIWVEGSYSIGSKMKTVSTIFDPEGNAQSDGTYDLGQMSLPTYNTETKSTNFSAFGVHGGIVIGVGTTSNKGTPAGPPWETNPYPPTGTLNPGEPTTPPVAVPTTHGFIKNDPDPEWDTLIPGGPMFPPSGISVVEESLDCKCCGKTVSGTVGENINHIKTCCKKKDDALMKKMQEEMIAKHKITSTQNMQGGGSWVLYSCVCCKEAFQTEDELFDHKCAKGCFGTPIRNTGTVKDIELKLLTDGSTTQDGTPIVGTTIAGTITGIKKPAEIKIIQSESGDSGTAITNKKGNFIVTVKKDTTHKIYVNGVEYGKIKIISKQENDAFKCDCCGGTYGYDNFLKHAKTCCPNVEFKKVMESMKIQDPRPEWDSLLSVESAWFISGGSACQLEPTCDAGGIYCRANSPTLSKAKYTLSEDQILTASAIKLIGTNNIVIYNLGIKNNLTVKTLQKFIDKKVDVQPTVFPLSLLTPLFKSIDLPEPKQPIKFDKENITYEIINTTNEGQKIQAIQITEKTKIIINGKEYNVEVITTSAKGSGSPKQCGFCGPGDKRPKPKK